MILNALAAAFALLSLNFSAVSTPAHAVESSIVTTQVAMAGQMSSETEWTLISEYAAPNWSLSVPTAWSLYEEGEILITEIIPEENYKITYGGGYITVVLESGHD